MSTMYRTLSTVSLDDMKLQLKTDSENYESESTPRRFHIDEDGMEHCNSNPISFREVEDGFPELIRSKSVEDLLSSDYFFAESLCNLSDNLLANEESNFFAIRPIHENDFHRLSSSQKLHLLTQLKNISESVTKLRDLIKDFNCDLTQRYQIVIANLKLNLLINVKKYGFHENSRVMYESLLKLKELFSSLNFNSLNDLLDDINDCVFEYNHSIDEFVLFGIEPYLRNVPLESILESDCSIYKLVTEHTYIIETTLNANSAFVCEECSLYKEILGEVVLGFSDFVDHFKHSLIRNSIEHHEVFRYELISFDNHLKSAKYSN